MGETTLTDGQIAAIAIVGLILLAALIIVLFTLRVMRSPKKPARPEATVEPTPPAWPSSSAPVEIARIREEIETTGLGAICFVLLLLHQVGCFVFFNGAKSAIQEAAVAAIWIGGNVLWGLGVALGRRRTYVVTRAAPKE